MVCVTSAEGEVCFLANRKPRAESVDCTFRVSGRQPEQWNPVSGEQRVLAVFEEKNGCITVPLEFEPHGSMFVVFRKRSQQPEVRSQITAGTNFPKSAQVQELTGPWTVQFDPQWFYPLDGLDAERASGKVILESLVDWTQRPELPIKHFSGTATYRTAFNATIGLGSKVYLDLGSVKEIAVVRLNGENLGTIWRHPWRVEITKAVRDGANASEIDVANLWPNRLIGDAELPREKRRTRRFRSEFPWCFLPACRGRSRREWRSRRIQGEECPADLDIDAICDCCSTAHERPPSEPPNGNTHETSSHPCRRPGSHHDHVCPSGE